MIQAYDGYVENGEIYADIPVENRVRRAIITVLDEPPTVETIMATNLGRDTTPVDVEVELPHWLDVQATKAGLDLSKILEKALIKWLRENEPHLL
jgi:hypothetical protein